MVVTWEDEIVRKMEENSEAMAKIVAVERHNRSSEQAVAMAQAAQDTAEHATCNAQQEMRNHTDRVEHERVKIQQEQGRLAQINKELAEKIINCKLLARQTFPIR